MSGKKKVFIMETSSYIAPEKGGYVDNISIKLIEDQPFANNPSGSLAVRKDSSGNQPFEDGVLKVAALFMGKELLPMLGIERKIRRIAPAFSFLRGRYQLLL